MSILYLAALTSNYVTDIKTFNSFEIKLVITQNIIYFVDGQAVRFCKNTQNQIARCIYLGITGRFLSGRLIREIFRMPNLDKKIKKMTEPDFWSSANGYAIFLTSTFLVLNKVPTALF